MLTCCNFVKRYVNISLQMNRGQCSLMRENNERIFAYQGHFLFLWVRTAGTRRWQRAKEKEDISMSSKLVMVIDDSPAVRKIVETCLKREGFTVASFADGIEAMQSLTSPRARVPDLVVLDIGLPKMDGYEVARCLKTKPQFRNTVIIMLSRREGLIDRLKGRLAGAKEYITKPFKTQEFIEVVESYLGVPILI